MFARNDCCTQILNIARKAALQNQSVKRSSIKLYWMLSGIVYAGNSKTIDWFYSLQNFLLYSIEVPRNYV